MALVSAQERIPVAKLVNPDGENGCLQQLDDDITNEPVQGEMEGADTSDDDVPLPDAKEQLWEIALTRRICEGNGEGNSALFRASRRIQAKTREQVKDEQVQTKVDNVLNKI